MAKNISKDTARVALDLVDEKIESEKAAATIGDLADLFDARKELAALAGDEKPTEKKSRKSSGSRKVLGRGMADQNEMQPEV